MQQLTAKVGETDLSDNDLLNLYLAAPPAQRVKLFADTARVATLTGVSRRTIQLWIETGAIRAIAIGKRYEIYLPTLTFYLQNKMKAKVRS